MSYMEAIQKRISCRTYQLDPLTTAERGHLLQAMQVDNRGPFGGEVTFQIVELEGLSGEELRKLGTYGMIRGARTFIAGKIMIGKDAMKDYGYCLETVILKAAGLGLGTCWLGGTFNRSGFATQTGLGDTECMPAVTPVGRPADREALVGRITRRLVKARNRKPWQEMFFLGSVETPLTSDIAGNYTQAIEAVRLAPSASNKQPWRIFKEPEGNLFHFYLLRDKVYDRAIGKISIQEVDMGIAMSHFELVAREAGLKGDWKTLKPEKHVRNGMEYIVTWVGK